MCKSCGSFLQSKVGNSKHPFIYSESKHEKVCNRFMIEVSEQYNSETNIHIRIRTVLFVQAKTVLFPNQVDFMKKEF